MHRYAAWVVKNLAGALACLFVVKDFLAFMFLKTHAPTFESEFLARMAFLPGSALFWDFAGWLAPICNALFGAFIGWLISKTYRAAK